MSALAKNYNRKKIAFKKGKGSFLYATNGKKYLDFCMGIAVCSLGHANPYLIKAINKQSKKLWHVSNAFQIPEGEKLAKKLTQKTFADSIIFQNSGVEATEAAIKVAKRYFYSIGQPKKNRILCIKNSFHGRTLATIFASGSKKMTEGFYPKVDGFDHFNFGNHKELEKKITSKTAAIMVETIMGEGGIKVIPDFCLRGLRKICNRKKILLILDEVQCGIGRTGKFFAFEHAKIKPDIVPIAKGIGGGFQLGACLMTKKVALGMKPGSHGTTFGGNPVSCAAAIAAFDVIKDEDLINKSKELGAYLNERLFSAQVEFPDAISEIRGIGLWYAFDIKPKKMTMPLVKEMQSRGVIVGSMLNSEGTIRVAPPLTIRPAEIDAFIGVLKASLRSIKREYRENNDNK